MIKIPLTKLLFLDIETVGLCRDYSECEAKYPKIAKQFDGYFDWFLKRFPEDKLEFQSSDEKANQLDMYNHVFKKRAALTPEFAKIICVSVAFVTDNGEIKKQTLSDHDERKLLHDVQKMLNKTAALDYYLCGHNLKNFDVPMMAKRMMINGLRPANILPSFDTKPWEVKVLDTKEIWQYGAYTSIGSLDLMCTCLDVESSKLGEITGDIVHHAYWEENRLKEICEYCERDVLVLIEIINKLKSLE